VHFEAASTEIISETRSGGCTPAADPERLQPIMQLQNGQRFRSLKSERMYNHTLQLADLDSI
jgi:hypothetical protein